eukprot:7387585-Heterocapsa_arctica.AAC.1
MLACVGVYSEPYVAFSEIYSEQCVGFYSEQPEYGLCVAMAPHASPCSRVTSRWRRLRARTSA